MKKLLLFTIISLLSVCSIACNSPKIEENICYDDYADIKEETLPAQLNTTTLNTAFSEVTNVDVTADVKISYEDILKETENYFRFFIVIVMILAAVTLILKPKEEQTEVT